MAVSQEQVVEALRPVQDPELNMSIVDLDMVKAIKIRRGRVSVTIALTVAGCPMRTEITKRVTEAVGSLAGVDDVAVELTVMTDEELHADPAAALHWVETARWYIRAETASANHSIC